MGRCNDLSSFGRRDSLLRHMRTLHGDGSKAFVCHAVGCSNRGQPWAFARADTLTSHIKARHNPDTLFDKCPVQHCNYGASGLAVLAVHILRAHGSAAEGRPFTNASRSLGFRCPVRNCSQSRQCDSTFKKHLEGSHSLNEVLASSADFYSRLIVLHHLRPGSAHFTVGFRCPVCNITCDTRQDFWLHLSSTHLRSGTPSGSDQNSRSSDEVVAQLYPFRFQILALSPQFVSHDVFEDISGSTLNNPSAERHTPQKPKDRSSCDSFLSGGKDSGSVVEGVASRSSSFKSPGNRSTTDSMLQKDELSKFGWSRSSPRPVTNIMPGANEGLHEGVWCEAKVEDAETFSTTMHVEGRANETGRGMVIPCPLPDCDGKDRHICETL